MLAIMLTTTVKEGNVSYALKFAELWASRYTEAVMDNFKVYKYYNWTDAQIEEYFNFAKDNVLCNIHFDSFWKTSIADGFLACFTGDPSKKIKDVSVPSVDAYLRSVITFGE